MQLQLKTEILKISRCAPLPVRFIRSPSAGRWSGRDFVSRRNANSPRNNDILTGISMGLINTSGNRGFAEARETRREKWKKEGDRKREALRSRPIPHARWCGVNQID